MTPHTAATAASRPRITGLARAAGRKLSNRVHAVAGLAIVAALARSSGVRASQVGKTGWFTLALTDRAHRPAGHIDHEPEAAA